jgi:hypothetical protein
MHSLKTKHLEMFLKVSYVRRLDTYFPNPSARLDTFFTNPQTKRIIGTCAISVCIITRLLTLKISSWKYFYPDYPEATVTNVSKTYV